MIETEEIECTLQEETSMRKSFWETASKTLSALVHPFLVPLYAYVLLFSFTYLNIMPIQYMTFVLSIVTTFTIVTPFLFISLYKWLNKLSWEELGERKRRLLPYILTLMSYVTCLLTMQKMHFPHYFSGLITAISLCAATCLLLNFRWRVSIHLAGCGMFIGGLLSYSLLFYFNPVWWLCGFILLAGIQGTARISFHQHTLLEVILGFIAGMFCGVIGILFI